MAPRRRSISQSISEPSLKSSPAWSRVAAAASSNGDEMSAIKSNSLSALRGGRRARSRLGVVYIVTLFIIAVWYMGFFSTENSSIEESAKSTETNASDPIWLPPGRFFGIKIPGTSSSGSSEGQITKVSEHLPFTWEEGAPICQKLFLFTFLPWWGFASEYTLYIRAAVIAKKMGYTLVEDDSGWNYGRLSNFFEQRKIDCEPPSDWADYRTYAPILSDGWTQSPRLRWSRNELSLIDDWTRENVLDLAEVGKIMKMNTYYGDKGTRMILGEGESLPRALIPVFELQSDIVMDFWKLNQRMQAQVKDLSQSLGLSRRPWLVPGDWTGAMRDKVMAQIHKLGGERAQGWGLGLLQEQRRGPFIGAHIRLGDKGPEYKKDMKEMGITNTFGNMTVYAEAAQDAYRRLLPSAWAPLSPTTPFAYAAQARPNLLVMTAEPLITRDLEREPLLSSFHIVQTPEADLGAQQKPTEEQLVAAKDEMIHRSKPKTYEKLVEDQAAEAEEEAAAAAAADAGLAEVAEVAEADAMTAAEQDSEPLEDEFVPEGSTAQEEMGKQKKERSLEESLGKVRTKRQLPKMMEVEEAKTSMMTGYDQFSFNSLPVLERVIHTQSLVRDLTLMVQKADAFVVSGSSNIGRLAMLMGGLDAVRGPRSGNGRGLGGRIRSIDGHWYPTSYYSAMGVELQDNNYWNPEEHTKEAEEAAEAEAADEKRAAIIGGHMDR